MGKKNTPINLELMTGWVIGIAHNDKHTFLEKCQIIKKKIEEYTEAQTDIVHDLFNKPAHVLDPLEDLWRKENSPDRFVIPDRTQFYKWIVKKMQDNEKS